MIVFVLVGIIIFLLIKVYDFNNDKKRLEKEMKDLKEGKTNEVEEVPKIEEPNPIIERIRKPDPIIEEKKESPSINVESKHTEREIKNSSILIVGSFLIVLSAILFLSTTWDITNNLLKTAVLVVMLLVFLAASYLAENVLKIKQTAKAFYYIALAYIPIIFIAVYIFGLLGDYISIHGEGQYIYLFISSIMITIIYLLNYEKRNNDPVGYASFLFALLGCFFMGRLFTSNYNYVFILLSVFIAALLILYKNNIIILKDKIHFNCNTIFAYLAITIMVVTCYYHMTISEVIISDIINESIVLFIIYLLLSLYNKVDNFKYIYPFYIVFIFYNIGCICGSVYSKEFLILLAYAFIYFFELILKKRINQITYFSSLVIGVILVANNFSSFLNEVVVSNYIIFLLLAIFSLLYYIFNNESRKYTNYITMSCVFLSLLLFLDAFDYKAIICCYFAFTLLVASLFMKDENFKKAIDYVCNIVILVISIFYLKSNLSLVLFLAYTIYHFYLAYKNNNYINRFIAYIYTNVVIFNIFSIINITDKNMFVLIVPCTTLIIFALNSMITRFKDEYNKKYLLAQFIISFILLYFNYNGIMNTIFIIILNIAFVSFKNKNKLSNNYLYINFISLLPYIFNINALLVKYISILAVLTISILLYYKKDNVYLFSSLLYLVYTSFHHSKYTVLLLFSIICICAYRIKEDSSKSLFQGLLYICGVLFLEFLFYDYNIVDKIDCIKLIPIMIFIPLLSRTILKPNKKQYKLFEYLSYGFINLYAFSDIKGLEIFVGVLIVTIIISYALKHGPIFIISLAFVVLDVIKLTIDFWLSVPWWIYVLLIGSILIFFAMHNELKEKRQEKLIDKLKQSLDL